MEYNLRSVLVVLPIVLLLFFAVRSRTPRSNLILGVLAILIFVNFTRIAGAFIFNNLSMPPQWDFLVFWLDGQVAAQGGNFYDANNYLKIELPYQPDEDFVSEVMDIGFRYPPFTMFFFLPLGYLEFNKAYLLWQAMNFTLLITCAYILWQTFLKRDGWLGFGVVLSLLAMLRPASSTFAYAQSNFIILLAFSAFWLYRPKNWSGVFLTLGIMVKPYMTLILLYPILARRWNLLATALGSLTAVTLLSGVFFGFDVLASYLWDNSLGNLPVYLYTEPVNQSLLAFILRSPFAQPDSPSPLFQPAFLIGATFLAAVTFLAGNTTYSKQDNGLLLSILFFALLVYPASLEHYAVLLIVPILLLLSRSALAIWAKAFTVLTILAIYFFAGYQTGHYVFFANTFIWLLCIASEMGYEPGRLFRRRA